MKYYYSPYFSNFSVQNYRVIFDTIYTHLLCTYSFEWVLLFHIFFCCRTYWVRVWCFWRVWRRPRTSRSRKSPWKKHLPLSPPSYELPPPLAAASKSLSRSLTCPSEITKKSTFTHCSKWVLSYLGFYCSLFLRIFLFLRTFV
jgi:hypothetical protein